MTDFYNLSFYEQMSIVNLCCGNLLKRVVLHPAQLTLVWRSFDFYADDFDDCFDDHEFENSDFILNQIKDWNWDTVVFPKFTKITVFSSNTGNKDTRGGSCGDEGFIVDDFKWSIDTPNGITLKHITEGVYRMKGSKYDLWYELFDGISVDKSSTNDHLVLTISFDYESDSQEGIWLHQVGYRNLPANIKAVGPHS